MSNQGPFSGNPPLWFPNQWQPLSFNPGFNGNYGGGFLPNNNVNGSYQPVQNNPPIMNSPPQENAYGGAMQGPLFNYYPAFNDNNGVPCAPNNWYPNSQPPQNSMQMNSGENQVALTTCHQQMQQSHDKTAINLNTTYTFETGSLCMAKLVTDAVISSMGRVGPEGSCSVNVIASKEKYEISYSQNQNQNN